MLRGMLREAPAGSYNSIGIIFRGAREYRYKQKYNSIGIIFRGSREYRYKPENIIV